jgi:hypothetical protein
MKNLQEFYNELTFYSLALEDEAFIHQYIVDAFTAQSANETTKPISLTFALVGLYLFSEKNYSGKEIQRFHVKMSQNKVEWPIFELPTNRGEININTVLEAQPGINRNKMIEKWAHSVWMAFNQSHLVVKSIADNYQK